MDKPGCVLTQLYLQNQVEWICRKGHGLLTPRLEQRKNESKKTGLSRSSLINGENQNGARELRLLTEAEGSLNFKKIRSSTWPGLESGTVLPTPGSCFLQDKPELPLDPKAHHSFRPHAGPVAATRRCAV